jgi:hypothetical protein
LAGGPAEALPDGEPFLMREFSGRGQRYRLRAFARQSSIPPDDGGDGHSKPFADLNEAHGKRRLVALDQARGAGPIKQFAKQMQHPR